MSTIEHRPQIRGRSCVCYVARNDVVHLVYLESQHFLWCTYCTEWDSLASSVVDYSGNKVPTCVQRIAKAPTRVQRIAKAPP